VYDAGVETSGGEGGGEALRAPERIDRYLITGVLARGGMGIIYRARDEDSGAPVAIKTVVARGEAPMASLRREIQTLQRLRHPSIIRILAEGVLAGLPWYAMELVNGSTLADDHRRRWSQAGAALAQAGAGRLDEVLAIAHRLCEPLAFAHANGVVHRDLKPQNVLLQADGTPVLVDFGLAGRFASGVGRELPDVCGAEGTPFYMAPEQIAGAPADARSDLYALGCMLFELVTNRPPFVGGPSQVRVQHQRRVPPLASSLIEGVPPALNALLMGLLAKDPRERIGHAEEVALLLEELGVAASPSLPRAAPVPYLYRPGLRGRAAEQTQLQELVARTRRGFGALVLIGGESGIGKTFLAVDAAQRARADELRVATGSCAAPGSIPSSGGSTFHPFVGVLEMLVDYCLAAGAAATARIVGGRGRVLAPVLPLLRRLVGGAAGPGPLDGGEAPELSGAAAREQLFDCLQELLVAFAREQPLVILLDDLQWADELTLRFLASRPARWLADVPLLLLGTYRSDEVADEVADELGNGLGELLARADAQLMILTRLDGNEMQAIACDMLAVPELPEPLARTLAEQSEGNPFFVAEYLRTGTSDGQIRRRRMSQQARGRDTWAIEWRRSKLPLPSTIQELIHRRLRGLRAPAQRLLELAAVMGRDVDMQLVERAGLGSELVLDGISELITRQVLDHFGPDGYRFLHDKLREVVYDGIAAAERAALHRTVAAAIEAQYAGSARYDTLHTVLAHHWEHAAEGWRAIDHLERAGAHALATAAYAEAAAAFRSANALAATMPVARERRVRWEHGLSKACFGLGDLAELEEHMQAMLQLLGRPLPKTQGGWMALLARELGVQLWHLSGHGRRLAAGTAQSEDQREAALAVGLAPLRYFYREEPLPLLATALLSVNLAEEVAVDDEVPRSYSLMGWMAGLVRQHRLASRYFARAQAGAARMHDPLERSMSLMIESVYLGSFGRWGEAELRAQAALDGVRGIRDPVMSEMVLTTLGHVEYFTGRFERARERYLEVLASATERNNLQHECWARFSIARSLNRLGRYAEALPLLEQATGDLERQPEPQSEVIAYALLAMARLRSGQPAAAEAACGAALERIRSTKPTGYPPLEGYVDTVEVLGELIQATPPGEHRRTLEKHAGEARLALYNFALMYPVGRPSALLVAGEACLAGGHGALARWLFTRAGALARRFGMPREEAAAELAFAFAARGEERIALLAAAERDFARLGCRHELERIQHLRAAN
jgi:tetratricopeptide (TPR) repeat protein